MKITLTQTLLRFGMAFFFILFMASCSQDATSTQDSQTDDTEAVAGDTEEETPAAEERPSPAREVTATIGSASVKINYSSPGVKEREVWGALVPNDQVWRTGANEATTLEVDQDVTVNGQALPAGRYSLFTIPAADGDWTVIFNTVADQWGAYEYDESKDALRVMATPVMEEEVQERMEFIVGEEGMVTLAWEKLRLPLTFAAAK